MTQYALEFDRIIGVDNNVVSTVFLTCRDSDAFTALGILIDMFNDSHANGFVPTVLTFVDELGQRWVAWNRSDGFVMPPKPLAQLLDK